MFENGSLQTNGNLLMRISHRVHYIIQRIQKEIHDAKCQ